MAAVLAYMSVRPAGPCRAILYGRPLSWPALLAGIRRALVSAGVDVSRFSGHSFQIGAATTAAVLTDDTCPKACTVHAHTR